MEASIPNLLARALAEDSYQDHHFSHRQKPPAAAASASGSPLSLSPRSSLHSGGSRDRRGPIEAALQAWEVEDEAAPDPAEEDALDLDGTRLLSLGIWTDVPIGLAGKDKPEAGTGGFARADAAAPATGIVN